MGKIVRGSCNGISMGKSTELGMSFCSPQTRIILHVDEFEKGWKAAEYGTHVEEIDEIRRY